MKIRLECNECERKFSSASLDPRCPKCGGCDSYPIEYFGTAAEFKSAAGEKRTTLKSR